MFVDKVTVEVMAGDGGDGIVSFRKEKYIDRGGPNGGDGGHGGDVVFVASEREHTLSKFRYDKRIQAENGQNGGPVNRRGKSAPTLEAQIPVGTQVSDSSGLVIADLTEKGQKALIAAGGQGGYGNAHFKSSTRQAPLVAEKGEPGQKLNLTLELKMIADVGLVGLPNSGKSTLISVISKSRPEIADYPFTTLKPNLGMAKYDDQTYLVADIPGIIEGAHQGKGLGFDFLRHVERTKLIVHMIDIMTDDLQAAYQTIRTELESYSQNLASKRELVVLTKADLLDSEMISSRLKEVKQFTGQAMPVLAIASQTHQNVDKLQQQILKELKIISQLEPVEEAEQDELKVYRLAESADDWRVTVASKGQFLVQGQKIERFAHKTRFDDFHSQHRLRDICQKIGIMHQLVRLNAAPGDTVIFGEPEIGRLEL